MRREIRLKLKWRRVLCCGDRLWKGYMGFHFPVLFFSLDLEVAGYHECCSWACIVFIRFASSPPFEPAPFN
jgi:hypothetical protein